MDEKEKWLSPKKQKDKAETARIIGTLENQEDIERHRPAEDDARDPGGYRAKYESARDSLHIITALALDSGLARTSVCAAVGVGTSGVRAWSSRGRMLLRGLEKEVLSAGTTVVGR